MPETPPDQHRPADTPRQAHYFTDPGADSPTRTLTVRLAGRDREVVVSGGVFSGHRLDLGTSVLLRSMDPPPATGTFLDLGCGWGPIALTLGLLSPEADVWAIDVNPRALELTGDNGSRLGLTGIRTATPEDVPADLRFDVIWSNPPIRVGKPALHAMLATWLHRLSDDGSAHLVVQRNLGADSLISWINDALGEHFEASKMASAKGFRVIQVARR